MTNKEKLKHLRVQLANNARVRAKSKGFILLDKAHKGQGRFRDSTFLFIQAIPGDRGSRPLPADTVFWNSPHVELYSGTSLIATNQVQEGRSYTVEVTVSNDGDLQAPSCSVDLFLCNPSLGFSTVASTLLGVQHADVPPHGTAKVVFTFTATAAQVGHRCLFARAYSVSTEDMPTSASAFDVMGDRHIGQQNLSIVEQGQNMAMQIIPPKQGKFKVRIRRSNSVLGKLQGYTAISRLRASPKGAKKSFALTGLIDVPFPAAANAIRATTTGRSIGSTARLLGTRPILTGPATGTLPSPTAAFARLLRSPALNQWEFPSIANRPIAYHRSTLVVPHLGLIRGEATAYLVEMQDARGRAIGGITVVVKG